MSNFLKTALLGGSALMMAGGHAAPASAQVANAPIVDAEESEEIVVTANKREQSLQDVPAQVSALTGDALEQQNATALEEFAGLIPGLSVSSAEPGSNLVVVRGATTGSQASNAVGLYLDDVPVGSSSSFAGGYRALSINAFDLDRVEVLSGPQGTLYGASSLGGTIKYITTAPDQDEFGGRLEGEVSQMQHGGTNDALRGMLNTPFGNGRGAVRFDAYSQNDSGYVQDPTHGRDDIGASETRGARIAASFDLTDSIDLRLSAFTQEVEVDGQNVVTRDAVTGAPITGTYDQSFDLTQGSSQSLDLYSGTLNWDLGGATLTSVTGYQEGSTEVQLDLSRFYSGLLGAFFGPSFVTTYRNNTRIDLEKFTQELRLASPNNERFEWLIGAYYTDESASTFTNILNAADPTGTVGGTPIFEANIPTTYEEISAFANATIYFTPQLDLTIGVRQSHNEQTFTQNSVGLLNNFFAPTTPSSIGADSEEDVTTWLVNPRWRVNEDVTVYFRAANGFRPGGPNYVLSAGLGSPTFDPDTLTTYEAGVRANVFDGRGSVAATVYHTDWSDIQLSVVRGGVNQLENAGDAEIDGAEFSGSYELTPDLTIGSSVTYTDARLATTAPDLGVLYEGARLPVSPEWSYSVNANYRFDIWNGRSGRFNISDVYTGERTNGFAGSAASPLVELNDYHLLNADLTFELTDTFELSVFGKNLLDEEGEVTGNRTDQLAVPGAPTAITLVRPLQIGVQANFRF